MSGEKGKNSERACSNVDEGESLRESAEDDSENALEAALQSLNDTLCEGSDTPVEEFSKITLDSVVSHTLKTIARVKRSSLKAKAIERKNRRLRRQLNDLLEGIKGSKGAEGLSIFRQMAASLSTKERGDEHENCAEDMSDCD